MSFATFSGPIRSGTVKDGTAPSGRNTGLVLLNQAYDTGVVTAGVGNVDVHFGNLPMGAEIVSMHIDQIVVPGGTSTSTISVGTSSGAADLFVATATTAGGRFNDNNIARLLARSTLSTTADTQLWARYAVGVAAGAGRAIITVQYVQRADDGSQNPASS